MTITKVRLVDGPREMSLSQRDDLRLRNLDVPYPAVRAVTEDRADDDGSRDTTNRHGARAVGIQLRIIDRLSAIVDELGGFLHPSARPYLHVTDDEWSDERRLRLRVDQQSAPMGTDLYPFGRDVQVQWVAPDGVWEQAQSVSFTVNADTGVLTGRTYPLSFPRTYPTTQAAGALEHTNPGNSWQHYVARLYGPCVGPRFTNDTTGQTLAFTDQLVIPAGDYVEVNTQDRTAYYLSQAGASRLNNIDFANSQWWRLAPGLNRLRYHPISGVEAGSAAWGEYRPAWL